MATDSCIVSMQLEKKGNLANRTKLTESINEYLSMNVRTNSNQLNVKMMSLSNDFVQEMRLQRLILMKMR